MPEATETIETAPIETKQAAPQGVTLNLFAGKKPAEVQKAEAAKETPAETPKETPKEVLKETPQEVKTPKKTDPETNLAAMRKKLEEIEASAKAAAEERDKVKAEYESYRAKPELPEDVKTKLSAVEQYEKELTELKKTIRQTNLAQDPEFREKYDKPINARIAAMGKVALASGVSENEWRNAVASWDKEKFGEWMDTMTPGQRIEFQASWQKAVELYTEQHEQLQNHEKVLADMERQRKESQEAQQREYFTANERLAREKLKLVLSRGDAASYEGLSEAAEAVLMKAARHEMPADEIFEQLAANQVLARSVQKQAEALKERESKIAELEQKIAEQDKFITAQAGSVPRQEAAGTTGKTEGYVPPWKRIVVG